MSTQLQPGFEEDGFRYVGGDPSSPTSWEPAGTGMPKIGAIDSGFRFLGGDPGDPASWEEAREPPRREAGQVINDTLIEFVNAAAGGVGAAANFIKPGNAVSGAIDDFVDFSRGLQSEAVKVDRDQFNRALDESEGIRDDLSAVGDYVLSSPLQVAAQAAGSFMVPGSAIATARGVAGAAGLGARGASRAGLGAGMVTGAAMGGGDAAGTAHEMVMGMSDDVILASPQGQALAEQGHPVGEVREMLAQEAARDASILPALAGAAAGAFGAERILAGGRVAQGGVRGALATGAVEAVTEAAEEGLTQYEGQRHPAAIDPSIDPTKNVAAMAAMGAIQGGAIGAGVGAMSRGPGGAPELTTQQVRADELARQQAGEEALRNATTVDEAIAAAEDMAGHTEAMTAGMDVDAQIAATRARRAAAEQAPAPAMQQSTAIAPPSRIPQEQVSQPAPTQQGQVRTSVIDAPSDQNAAEPAQQPAAEREPTVYLQQGEQQLPVEFLGYEHNDRQQSATHARVRTPDGGTHAVEVGLLSSRPASRAAAASAQPQIAASPPPAQPPARAETQPQPAATPPVAQTSPAVSSTVQSPTPTGDPEMDGPASWVIRNRDTGEVITETFEQRAVEALNTAKYEAVPVAQHLREINDPASRAAQVARGEPTQPQTQPAVAGADISDPQASRSVPPLESRAPTVGPAPEPSASPMEPAPPAAAVVTAFSAPNPTAEQQEMLGAAQRTYSADDLDILRRAAMAPFTLTPDERVRHRELRAMPHDAPVEQSVPASQPNIDPALPPAAPDQASPTAQPPDVDRAAATFRPEPRLAPPERQRLAQLQERRGRLIGRLHGTTGQENPVVARELKKVDDQIARIHDQAYRRGAQESRDPLLFGADTGVPMAQVQAMVDRITANLPGSSNVEIRVVRTRLDVDDAEGVLPSIGAEGIYFPASETDGQLRPARIYLMAQALPTMERAEQVLAHELVGHFGMEAMLGDRFSAVLEDVIRLGRAPNGVQIGRQRVGDPYYATMDAVAQDYPDYSPANQAREVLARMAETNVRPHLLEIVYAHIRRFLRGLGIQAPLSAAEIKTMVVDAAKQLRSTTGQQATRGSMAAAESLRAAESRRRDETPGDTSSSIQEVIGAAREQGHARQKAVLGPVSDWLIEAGRDAGFDLNGYIHVLDGSAVRHTMKNHYDERTERARGQLPVTDDDLMLLSFVVQEPDRVVFGTRNRLGKDQIGFVRRLPDGTILYLEEVRTKRRELAAVSVRKYPATMNVNAVVSTLHPNAQGDGGNELIVVAPEPRDNNAQDSPETLPDQTPPSEGLSSSGALESRGPTNIFGDPVDATWQAPAETKLDHLIYLLQNKHVDLLRVTQEIHMTRGYIEDQWNPYLKEELYHGRAAKHADDFMKELEPLLDDMESNEIELKELDTYLHNLHAEERNVQIAKVNPAMKDGGSGISTADARAYLAGLDPAKRRNLEALAKQVQEITAGTRRLLVESGLESPETIRAWESTYSNYVPLQREDMDVGASMGTGQGYSTRGSSSKRATGSDRKVVDILANVVMQRERAITRAEKNRVAVALYGLATLEPNTNFWMAINPQAVKDIDQTAAELVQMGLNPLDAQNLISEPKQAYIDPRTGLVAYRVNPALRNAANVVAVRVNGEDRFVFFNERNPRGQRMAAALKNLDVGQLPALLRWSAMVTRWFAAVNTQWNAIFGIVNITRDGQSAALQLTNTELAGKQKEVAKNMWPAVLGIYGQLRADRKGKAKSGAWADLWDQFQRAGGKTGYRDQFTRSDERARALEKEIKRIGEGKLKQFGRGIFDWLTDYNDALENGVRLAAFKTALDNGISAERAASIAKNLTVNFNRKGQVATQASAMYAFFNAAVQGTTRMAQTLKGPKGKRIALGGVLVGAAQAVLLAMAGFDEDEPPQFVRERNFIIPLSDGNYVTIPMPLGWNILPNTGRVITEWAMSGGRNTSDRIMDLIGAYADAFNPIGHAGLSLQTVAPTPLDPLAALSENRDWTGKPIAREDFNTLNPTPGYTRAKENSSAVGDALAYAINMAAGGTDFKPGHLSPTPDQIDYLIGQAFGGVGREVSKLLNTGKSLATGEEIPPYKVPLVGRFYGNTQSGAAESSRFYNNVRELNMHENEIKGRRETGGDVMGYLRDNPEARMVRQANKVEGDIRKLRQRRTRMLEAGVHRENIKMIETEITNRQKRFNDQVRRLREG